MAHRKHVSTGAPAAAQREVVPMPIDVQIWIHKEMIVPQVRAELEAEARKEAGG